MATTTAETNKQLAADKQTQTDTETPTLEKRKLAGLLESTIHYYLKDHFYAQLDAGADVNFCGLDDNNEYVNAHLIDAIIFSNTWAFDELLRRGANVHKGGKSGSLPLFEAAAHGNVHMVRELLAKGANPLDYRKGTCLPLMLECITSSALLESQSRWRYENESPDTDNTALKQQISAFFLQEGAYTPPKPSAVIPFVETEVIHVHYAGKLEILGTLLARHVSPTIPVSGTTRSPLELVRNPANHPTAFQSSPDEELEYIATEAANPNVLLFEMKFWNKRYTGSLTTKIVVHYDFEPSRQLIEGAVAHLNPHLLAMTESFSKDIQETGDRLGVQLSSTQNELKEKLEKAQAETARLQAELERAKHETKYLAETVNGVGQAVERVDAAVKDVDAATKKVDQAVEGIREVGNFAEMEELKRFKSFIKSYPNAEEAYNTILHRLKSIHKSAQAVAGGGVVVSEGPLGLVAKVFDVSTHIVEAIPLVGAAASKFFGLAASTARHVDGIRQTNIYENIAAMVPATGAGRIFESVARKLTLAYLPQFQRLLTSEEAQAQTGSATTLAQNTLKSRFKSPTERVCAYGIVFMVETVFHNMHALQQELKKPNGLETLLLNAVMQRKPEQGAETFWNTITTTLGMNQIPTRTQSGAVSTETWHPAHFWTMPGVKLEIGQGTFLYFAGNGTHPETFGFRVGRSLEDVQALGLTPTTETAVLTQAATATLMPPTAPSVNNRSTASVPPPSPRMMTAYDNASTQSSQKPKSCETKTALDVPSTPSAPKRSKSPFAGLRLPRFGQVPATTAVTTT